MKITRDEGGKAVREAWVNYVRETVAEPKPSHVAPWEELSEWDKEADRRIYDAVLKLHAKRMAELVDALGRRQQEEDDGR